MPARFFCFSCSSAPPASFGASLPGLLRGPSVLSAHPRAPACAAGQVCGLPGVGQDPGGRRREQQRRSKLQRGGRGSQHASRCGAQACMHARRPPQRTQRAALTAASPVAAATCRPPAPSAVACPPPPVLHPCAGEWEGVDESKPTTSLQLRLADGSRMVARFNTTHTVGDIRRFIHVSRQARRWRWRPGWEWCGRPQGCLRRGGHKQLLVSPVAPFLAAAWRHQSPPPPPHRLRLPAAQPCAGPRLMAAACCLLPRRAGQT
jgi:hypothetical protein